MTINELAEACHANALDKGFWSNLNPDDPLHRIALLGLLMTEAAEAIEAIRNDDFENFEEEIADIVIRALDISGGLGVDLQKAIDAKMAKNKNRAYMHGKKA